MTIQSFETIHNYHGVERTIVTAKCNGPGCENTIKSNDPQYGTWGGVLGFVNVNDDPYFDERPASADWCSTRCLIAWAAALDEKPSIIGRERFLMERVATGVLTDTWKRFEATELRELRRGFYFEVKVTTSDGEQTGRIARITIELDRVDHDA